MGIDKVKQHLKKRTIMAALVIAGSIIGAALLQGQSMENGIVVWLTAAVYILGILIAAWIMMPLVDGQGWLWVTAVLLALTIIFPGAVLNAEQWAISQLQQLGYSANTLFLILVISTIEQSSRYANKRWGITGIYVLIMLALTFLL